MSGNGQVPTAVMIVGFGGPDCLDSVQPFMCNLMGYEPSDELVERVRLRYLTIGGSSPLTAIAGELANKLEAKLAEGGHEVPVVLGMRYWDPLISDTLRGLHAHGFRKVIVVSLSPFESKVATGAYREALDEAAEDLPGMELVEAPLLHTLSGFGGLLVGGAAEALTEVKDHGPALLVFTAHSLPVEDLDDEDPYVPALRGVVDRIVSILQMEPGGELDGTDPRLAGVKAYGSLEEPQSWVMAFQSKGNRPGEWLGPDVDDVVDAAIAGGFKSIVVAPVGFATDHMETLYDLDVVLAGRVLEADIEFARAGVPNSDELLVDSIAEVIEPLL
ncbi:MAG: ferrochelatase [Coriobacteriia bacterium]|nr:ferrochelatase [Coriobacteriia bacterium]